MTDTVTIRDIEMDDVDWIVALNNEAVPHVTPIDRPVLVEILDQACYVKAVLVGERPAGFLIALWPGRDYDSIHYRWFSEIYEAFLYVDRVAIVEGSTRSGLGRALYADLEDFARAHGAPRIALEVNSLPPNPRSMAFHERIGFLPVGELEHDGGDKRVVLMAKPLSETPAAP